MKSTIEIRTKAVVFYEEGIQSAKEIGKTYNISERTVRRWAQNHHNDPDNGLKPKKTGPKRRSLLLLDRCCNRGFGKHTGLGLYLSREILSITGITIRENGEPGRGARFEILVPEGQFRFAGTG